MAERIKVLGQAATAATTETVLYTVPADTAAVVSSIVVCARTADAATFRVGVSVGGGSLGDADYLYCDTAISGNTATTVVLGVTLAEGDEIRVYASTANLTFSAFGVEVY